MNVWQVLLWCVGGAIALYLSAFLLLQAAKLIGYGLARGRYNFERERQQGDRNGEA